MIDSESRSSGRRETNKSLMLIKFLELLLACSCLFFHYYSFDSGDVITCFVATGTFCGYILILLSIFTSFLVKVKVHKRIDIFYSLIGAVLFVMSGVFIIEEWQYAFRTRTRDLALLKGAVSIITGVLLAFDCVFTFKDD